MARRLAQQRPSQSQQTLRAVSLWMARAARRQVQERGRPEPAEGARLEQASSPRKERLLSPRRLAGQFLMVQPNAGEGGQKHPGIQLERPLPKALPIDHTRSVAQVEDMAGIKRALHQMWDCLLRPRSLQHRPHRRGGGADHHAADSDHMGAAPPDRPADVAEAENGAADVSSAPTGSSGGSSRMPPRATRCMATPWAFAVVGGTLLVNLGVSRYEARRARELGSEFLQADAAHTRSDVLVTLTVLASLGCVRLGLPRVDAALSLLIAALIGFLPVVINTAVGLTQVDVEAAGDRFRSAGLEFDLQAVERIAGGGRTRILRDGSVFEQAGSTLNLFADTSVNRVAFGWTIPTSWFVSIQALFVIILAGVFAWLWQTLGVRGKEPATPTKFALGLMFAGISFVLLLPAGVLAQQGVRVSGWWLVAAYLLLAQLVKTRLIASETARRSTWRPS